MTDSDPATAAEVKKVPAEEDSDDEELFLAPPPESEDTFEDNNSNSFLPDEDNENTYGSPGLRDAFNDDDDENSKTGTQDLSGGGRRNKRKNFKPRNIVYNNEDEMGDENANSGMEAKATDEEGQEEDEQQQAPEAASAQPLNLSGDNPMSSQRKSLMPRKLDLEKESDTGSTPMDLSTGTATQDESKPSLSVVRPEVLFGNEENKKGQTQQDNQSALAGLASLAGLPFAPFLPSGLAGAGTVSSADDKSKTMTTSKPITSDTMKEAFQEVLKLYGVPVELAETIAKNAQSAQGKLKLGRKSRVLSCHPKFSPSC